jgi:hypothetical protein
MQFLSSTSWWLLFGVAAAMTSLLGLRERFRLRLYGTPYFGLTALLGIVGIGGWLGACLAMISTSGWFAAGVGALLTFVLGIIVATAVKRHDVFVASEEYAAAQALALERALSDRGVRDVLVEQSAANEELASLLDRLMAGGVPADAAARAIRNASMLRWYFSNPDPATEDVVITLLLWAKSGQDPRG